MEEKFEQFLHEITEKIIPLTRDAHIAYFDASISGKPEDYKKASDLELKLSKVYSDRHAFNELKKFKEKNEINDIFLKRQLDLLYNTFLSHQMNEDLLEEIIKLSTKVEEKFATYRAPLNGDTLTENQIDEILENSTDSKQLEETWLASKKIGEEIFNDVLTLVKLRNRGAQELGFPNYFEMSLELNEQNSAGILKIFDLLDSKISAEFEKIKSTIDEHLSAKYNVPEEKLMPWHYQDKFFQLGPKIYNVDLDKFFEDKDIVELSRQYFNGLDLNIDDILARSDLYEKEGKYQHAYCTDIDRSGDVRILCNIKPNYKWMGTMLHELGHAVYDKYINPDLPWLLRTHSHIFTTEAIAMLFGRFASNPEWLKDMSIVTEDEIAPFADDCIESLRTEQIIFSRWVQVVFRFEREMYARPDQDLNKLWWELVSKYQKLQKPEGRNKPDWAAKIHISLYPAYYHNYMLGELLASQLYYYIKDKVLNQTGKKTVSFVGEKEVGNYLKNLFFNYGAVYPWNEMIKKSTGEGLNPAYYATQFVENGKE